jgi:hypothetical protein
MKWKKEIIKKREREREIDGRNISLLSSMYRVVPLWC